MSGGNISRSNAELTKNYTSSVYQKISREESFQPKKRADGRSQMKTINKMDSVRSDLKRLSSSLTLRMKRQANFLDTTALLYEQFDMNTSGKINNIK